MDQGARGELIGRLAEAIRSVTAAHPLRVAIDGPPAAGKTTLADELAAVLRAQDRDVIRATIDDFLLPRAQRYRRGRYSAESCYFDAHDHAALCRVLLDPLGPGGDRRFQHAVYDRDTDTPSSPPARSAAADAVLLFDGVFLLRPELVDRWNLRIFVSVPFEKTVDRALSRSTAPAGSVADTAEIERSWRGRYIPAQQLYFATARPTDHADIIVYNDQLQRPAWEVRPHSSIHGIRRSPDGPSGQETDLPLTEEEERIEVDPVTE
ncbi:cytidylate kinase family protein [Microbispora triticiradicis]|uniref:cytidylate kinase family protein n=1 Tax=Microbispora triticiradicis TaxID=2200763 RepID=UPI001AD737A6|nr:cytidylate kinase family protein [Microbispora triticiradicis]MBO4274755.1 uridylate kinase [Microbispora triticiradicis]